MQLVDPRGQKRELAADDPRRAHKRGPAVGGASEAAPRLILVLDIDHTLVHAASVVAPLDPQYEHLAADVINFTVPANTETGGVPLSYKVKPRAGLADFLREAHAHFDLAVYTHGSPGYLGEILKIIDPNDIYFAGRIASRTSDDDTIKRLRNLPNVDPERLRKYAVIVDDRDDVWEEEMRGCVLQPRPFFFFESKEKKDYTPPALMQRGLAPPILHPYMRADPLRDEQLRHTLHSSLRKVRDEMALLGETAEVKLAVQAIRARVLDGAVLVFAGGLLSTPVVNDEMIWRIAVALGARCLDVFDETLVTHVVSAKHTQTVVTAANAQRHIHIVSPEWLLDCLYRTQRVPEGDYPLPTMPADRLPLGARVPSILPATAADLGNGAAAWQAAAADGDGGGGSSGDRVVATAVEATGSSADPRVAARVAAAVQGEPQPAAHVDPRIRARANRDAHAAAPPHAAASSVAAASGAPKPVAPVAGSAAAPPPRRPAADAMVDPRRARPPPPRPAPVSLPGPVAPLHVLEERLEAELRKNVKPEQHAELAGYLRVVRSSAESAAAREVALSSLVKLLADVRIIERILDGLGFVRPSDRPLDTLGVAGADARLSS